MTPKSRGILFKVEMVKALLDGRKTQTRRIGEYQNDAAMRLGVAYQMHATKGQTVVATYDAFTGRGTARWGMCECPYGAAGDRLYVREEHYRFGHWEKVYGATTKKGRQKWMFVADNKSVLFAPPTGVFRKAMQRKDPQTSAWHKRLARFMPRALSRIELEITEIRVERLNSISKADAQAEGVFFKDYGRWCFHGESGCVPYYPDICVAPIEHHQQMEGWSWKETASPNECLGSARAAFANLWCSVHGEDAWLKNEWVWCIRFKRIKP